MKLKRRVLITERTAVYHLMSRVVRRQFWLREAEREMFVRMMHRQAGFAGLEILSYCLMGNHFHVLARVPECPFRENGEHLIGDEELLRRYEILYGERAPFSSMTVEEARWVLQHGGKEQAAAFREKVLVRMGNLPVFMRELKQRFGIWLNARNQTEGTIWSARYKSVLVEDRPEILARVAAYIDLNPVRAELVTDPAEYRWCSYAAAMAGERKARFGLCRVYQERDAEEFGTVLKAYRLLLFGKGAGFKKVHRQSEGK